MIPSGQAVLGQDRDDYAVEFAFVAADAREKFCERFGWCTPAERRYVSKSVWNAARNARKRIARHLELFNHTQVVPEPVDDFEARMEARDLVRRLEARLGRDNIEMLVRPWDPELDQCSFDAFRHRQRKVRSSARRFLEKSSPEIGG